MPPMLNVLGPDNKFVIKYKGVFNLESLYKKIHTWYKTRHFEYHEDVYEIREKTREAQIKMRGWRDDTEYLRTWINISMRFWDLEKVDVVKDGKKKTMDRGRVRVMIELWMEPDAQGNWGKNKFFEGLHMFYIKYIAKYKIELYAGIIEEGEFTNMQSMIKNELGMETSKW